MKALSLFAILPLAVALAACGGGGGGSSSSTSPSNSSSSTTVSGTAVDGYLQGSIVFIDTNRDGIHNAGEPSTTTDLQGRYTLDHSGVNGSAIGLPIVVLGGIDSDTGYVFTGKLSARMESSAQGQVISPLTALVDAMLSAGLANSIDAAKQKVAIALGLTVDQLNTDPVAAIASNPAIYTKAVSMQRAIQLLAAANMVNGDSVASSQDRVLEALARTVSLQSSSIDVQQLLASLPLAGSAQAADFANKLSESLTSGLRNGGHTQAKSALRAWDQIRVRMQSDKNFDIVTTANKLDLEKSKTSTKPYYQLTQQPSSQTALSNISAIVGTSQNSTMQPTNTNGRLLASNCFQCHGTGGKGGFDSIQGKDAAEVREYLAKAANSSIMAAHAQGYTSAQLDAIVSYLTQ